MTFRLVTDDPSLAQALGGPGAECLLRQSKEDLPSLAQRVLDSEHPVGVLVAGAFGSDEGGALGALRLVDEVLLQSEGRVPVQLASPMDVPSLRALAQLRAASGHPTARFFERLEEARCPWAEHGIVQLPCSRQRLEETEEKLRTGWAAMGEMVSVWRRAAALDYLEQHNRDLRHALGSLDGPRGVARLLLGAVTSAASCLTAEQCTDALAALSPDHATQVKEVMTGSSYRQLLEATTRGSATSRASLPCSVEHLTVLLIDDDPQAARAWAQGFEVLLPSLATLKRRLCSRASVLPIAPSEVGSQKEPDLVLLDYDLGDLGLLIGTMTTLKSRWPFCPVIVFTRCDRVEIAQWSISNGASAFLVKEPAEAEARRSDAHFERFADLLLSLEGLNGRYRGLWTCGHLVRRFCHQYRTLESALGGWDSHLARAGRGALREQISSVLELLLTSGSGFRLPDTGGAGLGYTPRWAAACSDLLRVEDLLQDALALSAALDPMLLFMVKGRPMTSATQRWKTLVKRGAVCLPPEVLEKLTAPRGPWEALLGHPRYLTCPMQFSQVEKVLRRTALALSAASAHTLSTACSSLPRLALTQPPAPTVAGGRHGVTSRLGAEELVRSLAPAGADLRAYGGSLVSQLAELVRQGAASEDLGDGGQLSGKHLWLVDDHPESDYTRCLSLLLTARGARVTSLGFEGNRMRLVALGTQEDTPPDLVLVDLDMPEAEGLAASTKGGPAAIATVRSCVSPAVPLAVLTAHTDSLHLGEVLAAGAQDYLPRRHAGSDVIEGRRELLSRLARLVRFGGYSAPLRAVSDAPAASQGGLQSLENALLEVKCMRWRPEVGQAISEWGKLQEGEEPGLALDSCLQCARQAWQDLWLASAAITPSEARLPSHEDAWIVPILDLTAFNGQAVALAHTRRAHVALGNLFEPIVALLWACIPVRSASPLPIGFAEALQQLRDSLEDLQSSLEATAHRSWASKLKVWLQFAEQAYWSRSAWEHAREVASFGGGVPQPTSAAQKLSEHFLVAEHLLKVARTLCEDPSTENLE